MKININESECILKFDIVEHMVLSKNLLKKNVVLFGASKAGEIVSQKLSTKGVAIKCFCDNDKLKWGKKINEIPIISPTQLYKKPKDIPILISSMYFKEIKSQLQEQGFENIINAKCLMFENVKCIDKAIIEDGLEKMGDLSGIMSKKRDTKLIVSLTSYPERLSEVKYALFSIFNQNLKPDEVVLWFSYEEFPQGEARINEEILNFKKNGLTIKFCHNLKSYKKLVPAIKNYSDCIIVTADDDTYYRKDWLEKLYKAYLEEPNYIHCHRAHRMNFDETKNLLPYDTWEKGVSWNSTSPSFFNFFIGVGGVLYPPGTLYKDIDNENLFLKLCPTADDIWFWTMAVVQGTKINIVKDNISDYVSINPKREYGLTEIGTKLLDVNIYQEKNDEQLKAVFEYYDFYNTILK